MVGLRSLCKANWLFALLFLGGLGFSLSLTTGAQQATEPGSLKWQFDAGNMITSSPALDQDGTIVFGTEEGGIFAINPDGSLKWDYSVNENVRSAPAIGSDGTIYIGSSSYHDRASDGNLHALNPDGTMAWQFGAGGYVHSSPSVGEDGTIYIGASLEGRFTGRSIGRLYALNTDGFQLWVKESKGSMLSSPAIAEDGTIYFGSDQFYAVNPDGSRRWEFRPTTEIDSSPAIGADGTIYFGSDAVYALNPDGTQKWRYPISPVNASPVIGEDGTLYFAMKSYFFALTSDGTLKWRYDGIDPNGFLPAAAAVGTDGAADIIYFPDGNSIRAVRFDGAILEELWQFETRAAIHSSPVIGADGTLYVGCDDGFLYAISTESRQLADSPWPMFSRDPQHNSRAGGP